MKKLVLVPFLGAFITLLSACAQNSDQPAPTPEQDAETAANVAAHVVVGAVVGTPAKIAMGVGSAARAVEKKLDGQPQSSPTPQN